MRLHDRHTRRIAVMLLCLALPVAGMALAGGTYDAQATAACAPNSNGSAVGQCAATFTLTDARGRASSLIRYRGHPVLLNFWGVGCAYCARELPDLQRFASSFTKAGGVILGVNSWGEPRDLIASYARRYHISWTLLVDQPSVVADLYGVRGTPTNVFINRQGEIRALTIGPLTLAQFQQRAQGL